MDNKFTYKKIFLTEKEVKSIDNLADVLQQIWEESSGNPVTFAKKVDTGISECLDRILKTIKSTKKEDEFSLENSPKKVFINKFVEIMVQALKAYSKMHD